MDADSVIRLRGVIIKLARKLNVSATQVGLTPTQASLLSLIVSRGPVALPVLVELEGLNPTMLSRVIGRLVDADLIRRLPDPDDLRAVSVQATRAGEAAHRRIKTQRAAALSARVDGLSPEHVAALENALPALEALVTELQRAES
jgi:DNA-binding MarR family transcriptional regulator